MLSKVKLAMRITGTAYDAEITRLIAAACADLSLVGISVATETTDPILIMAIITYCRLHFGTPDDYAELLVSYDEQKAQLLTASGYGLPR